MKFDVDIFKVENVLVPAHNIQRSKIFFDFDERNLYFQLSNTMAVFLLLVIVSCRISLMLRPNDCFQNASLSIRLLANAGGDDLRGGSGIVTCAMSSRQLKMYLRASLDLIPVSPSWSSGVCRETQSRCCSPNPSHFPHSG